MSASVSVRGVRVTSSALPLGAATEATLLACQIELSDIFTRLGDGSQIVIVAASALPAGAATEATLATRLTEATFAARINTLGQKAMAASTPVVLASDQSAVPVTAPVLTKGTQGANGFSVQSLKDAGRARVTILFQAVAPAVGDTLLTLVKVTAGVAAAGATSIGAAAGKTLRIEALTYSIRAGAAAAAFGTLNLRQNPAGATVIGSQSELRVDLGTTAALVGASDNVTIPIAEGMEFSGAQTLGVSAASQAITNILSITLTGYEY